MIWCGAVFARAAIWRLVATSRRCTLVELSPLMTLVIHQGRGEQSPYRVRVAAEYSRLVSVAARCVAGERRLPVRCCRVTDAWPLGPRLREFRRHCQVADERAFFSLGAERPSLGQQAHVTSSH